LPKELPSLEQPTLTRDFVFPGDASYLTGAREAILEFLRPHFSTQDEEIDLFLALQEALSNAVMHGCRGDGAAEVTCSVRIDPIAFTIVVRDPGPGFDPEAATRLAESVTNASEHGRGICLMRSLVDEVRYSQGGTEVLLRKLRHPA